MIPSHLYLREIQFKSVGRRIHFRFGLFKAGWLFFEVMEKKQVFIEVFSVLASCLKCRPLFLLTLTSENSKLPLVCLKMTDFHVPFLEVSEHFKTETATTGPRFFRISSEDWSFESLKSDYCWSNCENVLFGRAVHRFVESMIHKHVRAIMYMCLVYIYMIPILIHVYAFEQNRLFSCKGRCRACMQMYWALLGIHTHVMVAYNDKPWRQQTWDAVVAPRKSTVDTGMPTVQHLVFPVIFSLSCDWKDAFSWLGCSPS